MKKYLAVIVLFLLVFAAGCCEYANPAEPDFWLDPPAALWENPPNSEGDYEFCPAINRWTLKVNCVKCHLP